MSKMEILAQNLLRWERSGLPQEWVHDHHGQWGHSDWLALLESLKRSDFWPMEPDAVGSVLEELKKGASLPAASTHELQNAAASGHWVKGKGVTSTARKTYSASYRGITIVVKEVAEPPNFLASLTTSKRGFTVDIRRTPNSTPIRSGPPGAVFSLSSAMLRGCILASEYVGGNPLDMMFDLRALWVGRDVEGNPGTDGT
jgi:hypothetical protein